MPKFHVVLSQTGPEWEGSKPMEGPSYWDEHAAFMDDLVERGFVVLGGPVGDERRVAHAVEASSSDDIRATLAHDPWEPVAPRDRVDRPEDDQIDGR